MDHCTAHGQTISHSRVNAHFQNSMAEKRIHNLQDVMRMMLVHAKHHWPDAINAHLWPYTLCTANEIHANSLKADGLSPIELFSDGAAATSPRHFHPFGCPVYMLNDRIQAGIKGPAKLEEHARVGVYLGKSPIHTCTIALVLNIETRLVSPQFHIQFANLFETVCTACINIHQDKATGFKHGQSQGTEQEPPIPDTYFLPQTECDHMDTLTQDAEIEVLDIDTTDDLPQRKMGSMTDVQSLSQKQSTIRSVNT